MVYCIRMQVIKRIMTCGRGKSTLKLKTNNLNEQAYLALKSGILNKELPPGTRLVDSQLAEQYGISRTPIRDALRKLIEEGLVVSNGTRGYSVFCPSAKDIDEIFELRLIMDLAASKKLIEEILPRNPSAILEIQHSFEAEEKSVNSTFVEGDEGFHETIIRLADNGRMLSFYIDLSAQTRAFRRSTSNDPKRIDVARQSHQRIFEGIRAMDLEATEKAIRYHVSMSRADALSDFSY